MTDTSRGADVRRWFLVAGIVAVSFVSGGWLLHGTDDAPSMPAPDLFRSVMQAVSEYYVDSLPDDSLYHKAATGLLEELNDPYSTLVEGESYRELTEQTTGNYGGLGIQIDVRDGVIMVVAPLPETPAERAGVEAGDQIIAVDGKSTRDLNQDDAIKTLRGAPGTPVVLEVRRPGVQELMRFRMVRETIHFRSVQPGTMLEGGVGLVQLTQVSETSAEELQDEIEALRKRGLTGLILDLRGNPGGLLDQGVAVSDLFLDKGQQIVSTRGRAEGTSRIFAAERDQRWPALPVVVLVNEYSASAAEIIAGALQDNDRAVVVGTPTFGKGLVQSLFRLGDGRALKLTTARWYTPSGRSIQREARNEMDQVAAVESIADGTDSLALDSLPTHKTISGRLVRGGGGIVPDRIVRTDTLVDGEKLFVRAVGGNVSAYRDALVATAIALKERGAVSSRAFVVTPEHRALVFAKLAEKGVALTEAEKAGAAKLVDDQLGWEIARYVFGRDVELARRAADDAQVREAAMLLRAGRTPAALLQQVLPGR
ncbi:MAG TPA: S41 family peptidase [Gemmatimonadales bacterium]|nr:S41 family peptidase [Gemmatimonadales bacterium]